MGKQFGGVFANWNGKVGNVVGRVRQGRTVLSIYQPNVANPQTTAQTKQRTKFSLMTGFMRVISSFIKTTFHDLDGYKTGNPFSSAIGYAMRQNPFDETGSEIELEYTKIPVSQGSCVLPYSPSASAEGNSITISWSDNSGLGGANADDEVLVLVYNATKKQAVWQMGQADRAERTTTLPCPTAWSMDTVQVYFAMRNPKSGECSASVHLGSLPL